MAKRIRMKMKLFQGSTVMLKGKGKTVSVINFTNKVERIRKLSSFKY